MKVNAQLSPSLRKLHAAVLIEKKLYIFGGFNEINLTPEIEANYNKNPDDRFFYLDVSIPFNTSNLPWRQIPDNARNLPLGSLSSITTGGVAVSIGGVNNDKIFFFNNEIDNSTKSISPVHSYNSPNNVWNTQNLSGVRPIGRNQMKVVTDYTGKIYLLGFTFQDITHPNGLFVCDTINLNCEIRDASFFSRLSYGATLLPNGIIVYMGGRDASYSAVPDGFKMIFLYDTINDKWDSKITTGIFPPPDFGITTVLGLKGDKIILFGGVTNVGDNNLYVLNLTSYDWYVPQVKGTGPVSRRSEHCANVIGKYMVVTFGFNGVFANYRQSGESDVLLLDISDDSEYVWTTSFDPTPLAINSPSSNPSNPLLSKSKTNNNIGIIIGITIGIILFISIISLAVFLFIKRRKIVNKAIPTPGDTDDTEGIPSERDLSSKRKEWERL
ncbi:hypothetical protein RclHR1_02740013 [Rhizophagus clarus]|uniref:Galactose oxidase n=1 Tax=Rhizophagus clarus TaxID=94130 RepID=A0A2Z6R694_9GLOM|nr:hypothetical protein RclHR1_02740013 [Rhizophagus clarus]